MIEVIVALCAPLIIAAYDAVFSALTEGGMGAPVEDAQEQVATPEVKYVEN